MATATKERKGTGITLDRGTLSEALAAVLKAVPARSHKPVLQNVRLAGGLLTGTDLEIRIDRAIDYHGEALLLPAGKLAEILRNSSGETVTLTPKGSSVTVQCSGGSWTLPTEDAAEFPAWEPEGLRPVCRVPADQFGRAVRAVAYAADTESSRFALGSVLVEMQDGTVTLVGTDGRRLSTYEIEVDQATDNGTTLIPARAIAAMASAAGHSEGAVQLEANSKEVVATIDGTTITARLSDGRFPKWRDVFPDRDVKPTIFNASELLAATRQAAIVTSEQSKGVTFAIVGEGIHLTARSSEAGESSVTCPILEHGQNATFMLDPRYVCDFLRNVDESEPAEIEAAGPGDAVMLRSGDCKAIIMPLAKE